MHKLPHRQNLASTKQFQIPVTKHALSFCLSSRNLILIRPSIYPPFNLMPQSPLLHLLFGPSSSSQLSLYFPSLIRRRFQLQNILLRF